MRLIVIYATAIMLLLSCNLVFAAKNLEEEANKVMSDPTNLQAAADPSAIQYYHVFPAEKGPSEPTAPIEGDTCKGLDALSTDCLNIEIEKEAQNK